MKNNKIFLIPLLTITIAIWGFVSYNIIVGFSSSNDTHLNINEDNVALPSANLYDIDKISSQNLNYIKLKRDPFKDYGKRKTLGKTSNKKTIKKSRKDPPLNVSITGLIVNKKSKILVLENLDEKKTYFLREGDTYKNLRIKKITNNSVEYLKDGELLSIKIR